MMEEIKYILNQSEYGTHKLIAKELGSDNLILDIGCNKGYLKQISDSSNIFHGIDYSSSLTKEAKINGYENVFTVNLNSEYEYKNIKIEDKYDIIVYADILEHLLDADNVLNYLQNYLKPNGKIIVSLPNIAHISIRLQLLIGKFNYKESGILDKTHLHFYTLNSARKFLNDNSLYVIKELFSSNRFGKLINEYKIFQTLLGYNLIFVCKVKK